MQFFVPFATDKAQGGRILDKMLSNLVGIDQEPLTEFIYEIHYKVGFRLMRQTVGQPSAVNEEVIIFIVKNKLDYLICTYSRGVSRGQPIVARYKDVDLVTPFDNL